MLRPSWTLGVLAFSVLVACGGKSFEGDGDAQAGSGNSAGSPEAGSGTGARDTGGTSSGGSGSGGWASGGSGNAGSAGSAQCDPSDFEDEQGGNVGVRLINGTNHPIYLGADQPGCGIGPLFRVLDANGQPLLGAAYCQATCAQLLSGNVIGCPAIACAVPGVITLQPGESALTRWNAMYSEKLSPPPACRPAGDEASCLRVRSVREGTYYFTAQAGSQLSCNAPDLPGACSCMPEESGGCITYDSVIAGPLLQAKVRVELDASYGIGGPGGGMARPVEIVFND